MKHDGSYARTLLGKQLCGKWRLLRVLGAGGMSTVFEGLHRNGKRVAIKVLHPELALNPRLRGRFKREAYVANQVDHPDVVSVIDDDISEDGLAFLVMEFLDGETLGGRLKRAKAPLDPAQVVTAALGVLDVLAVAHRSGVIHRDVKPDNIFLTRHDRRIKLLDFGIARVRELSFGGAELTGTGATPGTPAFMAPEQARGRVDEVDATTDLWGLGATMFALLTGRFVHTGGNSNELLIAAATRVAPPLDSVADRLPRGLAMVVDRALAFDKSARWPDADSMRAALLAVDIDRTRDVFNDDGFVPLAYEQNTLDESNEAAELMSLLVRSRGRPSTAVRSARSNVRLLYAGAMLTTLAVAMGGWLLQPDSPRSTVAARPPEAPLKAGPAPEMSASGPLPEKSVAQGDVAFEGADGLVASALATEPAPSSVQAVRQERVHAAPSKSGASPASRIEPSRLAERAATPPAPTADPLDRR